MKRGHLRNDGESFRILYIQYLGPLRCVNDLFDSNSSVQRSNEFRMSFDNELRMSVFVLRILIATIRLKIHTEQQQDNRRCAQLTNMKRDWVGSNVPKMSKNPTTMAKLVSGRAIDIT